MLCPRCGYNQNSGNICERCGQPLSGTNKVKGSKAPVILTLAALCGILFGVGLFFMFFSEEDKIQTQSDTDSSNHGGFVTDDSSSESFAETTSESTTADTTTTSETTKETEKETTKKTTEKPSETTTTSTKKETDTTTSKATTTTTTTKATTTASKPANISVIAASKLATMTTNQIKAMIGNNYKTTTRGNVPNGVGSVGITSDYFPNVLICYNGISNSASVRSAFEKGNNFDSICVFQGGYLGENAKVGEKFSDLIIKIQCLGAGRYYNNSEYVPSSSLIDGCLSMIYFDCVSEFRSLYSRYGTNSLDGCQTNAKSVAAVIYRQTPNESGSGSKAVVTTSRAPITIAPYDDASHMWAMPSGTTIYIESSVTVKGVRWYYVSDFRTAKGTRKFGFVKASDVRA